MTMIARVGDGLPLVASMQNDDEGALPLNNYQNQAKIIFRKLNQQSPEKCTIESGRMMFHYMIDQGVCYLVLCESTFSKKLAFTYLGELKSEFFVQYGNRVASQTRPYPFIEFDTYVQKTRKSYMDSRTRRNLNIVSTELQDVQRIMVSNIDDVMQRGVALSELGNKASDLASLSKKYKDDAHSLNMKSPYIKILALVLFVLSFLLYFRFWWI